MRYVEVGSAQVSVVGLGTWQFGSGSWGYGKDYASRTAPAIIHRMFDLGVNLIDTAELYGLGRSERIVGEAIAQRRDEAFVATKLLPIAPVNPVVEWRAHASAGRLGVDALDLYQLHAPNPVVPLRATMAAFATLQREGLVRNVGVSNFSLEQWMAAERALLGPVLTNQVRYSLVDRAVEHSLLPWAQQHGRVLIAYSPLGQGLLSGRYDEARRPQGMRGLTQPFLPENLRRMGPLLDTLREVAQSHGATSAQVALAWLVRRPNVIVIPGASSVEQAESNVAAADIALSDDEDLALTRASDGFVPLRGPAVLSETLRYGTRRIASRLRAVRRAFGT